MKKKIIKFLFILAINYFIFLLLNSIKLSNWSLSGDDLYSLSNKIPSIQSYILMSLSQFTGQYRHFTYLFFSLYDNLIPNFYLIFLLHGLLFSLIPTITYFLIDKKIPIILKLFLVSPIFFSPIFYYDNYTISSLANILISIITLILLYYYKNRKKLNSTKYSLIFLILVLLSFTIKETFIVPLSIYCLVQLLLTTKKNYSKLMYICISGLLFLVYFYKRSSGYQSNVPSDYFFVFDIKNSINNLGNMIAWIINYPRGWQYGAPVRYPIQKIISGIYLTFVLISYYLSFIKNKLEFFSINFFLFSSMILFVFLNNVHLFYMDLPFLFLLQLVVISTEYLYSKNIKFAYIFVGLWFLINLSNQFIIKEQWLEYSFVANSNKSAVNYLNILKENEFEKYDLICISEQNRGGFGTEDGRLVNHLGLKNFKVISTKDKLLPIECNSNNSLNLVNDAWDYQLYSQD